MNAPVRRIAHLDMDAFYASVELLRYPQLRGQPVVIGGRSIHKPVEQADGSWRYSRLREYVGRGVVTTSTYEARALGVFSAMGTMKAAKLAPDAILLPADFDSYRHYSKLFKAAVATVAPKIQDRGIDEIYIDLTDIPGETVELGMRLKAAVHAATGLTCSIGITPNKLLSKICSELDKPDGLTVLGMDEIPTRIWPLAARKINGIGPKASEKLAALGIHTIGDLAQAAPDFLQEHFGLSYAQWLHAASHGRDDRPVETDSETKSVSRETTFERNLDAKRDRAILGEIFTELCTSLARDLQRKGLVSKTIGVKLRYDDFKIVTRDLSLPTPTADPDVIRRAAGECVRRAPLDRTIRLLGVRASALSSAKELSEVPMPVQGTLL
jgi:DNA polymerase-4